MSTRVDKRHLKECYRITADRNPAPDKKVRMTVDGRTPGGKDAQFIFDMSFSQWCCVVREFTREWKTEREQRIAEISRINAALPQD